MAFDLKNLNVKNIHSPKQRLQKIILWVLGVHVFVIFSPLVINYFSSLFKPKEKKFKTINVSMVSPSSQKTSYKDPVLKPVPEQPKIKPKPKPPKEKPVVKPKPKPQNKPKDKPKPKDKNKVNPPKPKITKPKPVVNDNIYDLKVVKQIENKPPQTTANSTNTANRNENRKLIASDIQGEQSDEFNARIAGVIYEMWKAPNTELVNGRNLQAVIRIKIDNSGRIIECKLIKKSGFPAFDWTVYELIKELQRSRMPLPPDNRREFDFMLQPE